MAALVLITVLRKLIHREKRERKRAKSGDASQKAPMLYEPNPDGSKTLFVPVKGRVAKVSSDAP